MTDQINRYRTNANWLLACAELERNNCFFGVAGSQRDVEESQSPESELSQCEPCSLGAFAQLVEYGRRRVGLTVEALAEKADVDLEELVEIERAGASPSARTLHRLARFLKLPEEPLAEVAGLIQSRDEKLEEAVYRFAARSEPNASLTPEEEEAYNAFVEVLISQVGKQQ